MIRLQQGLLIALGIVLAAVMVALGFWQLEVYHRQGEAAAARRAEAPPIPLSSVARPGTAATEGFGRSVSFEGSYDPALQLLVPVGGCGPGSSAYSPDCGKPTAAWWRWYAAWSPARLAPPPPSGEVQQVGVLLPTEEHLGSRRSAEWSDRVRTLARSGPAMAGAADRWIRHAFSRGLPPAKGLAPAELQLPEVRRSDSQWGLRRAVVAVRGIHVVHGISDGARYRRTRGGGG